MGQTFRAAKNTIVLSSDHKKSRLNKTRSWIENSMDWIRVVSTDGKRINSDGPDSWQSWVPQNRPITRNKRQQSGPSMQVWGALVSGPVLFVFELPERGDSRNFMDFMEARVFPVLENIAPANYVLQQDRAPAHISAHSLSRFQELGIELLDWPSRSPDLNIIENCWSMMSRRIYDGRQFLNKDEPWRAIDSAVTEINVNCQDQLKALFVSIPKRMLEVVEKKGSLTYY